MTKKTLTDREISDITFKLKDAFLAEFERLCPRQALETEEGAHLLCVASAYLASIVWISAEASEQGLHNVISSYYKQPLLTSKEARKAHVEEEKAVAQAEKAGPMTYAVTPWLTPGGKLSGGSTSGNNKN